MENVAVIGASPKKERYSNKAIRLLDDYQHNPIPVAPKQEKIEVMESVWSILLIDEHLETHEDHFAHKLANLLRLTHKELIDAKLKVREQLAV